MIEWYHCAYEFRASKPELLLWLWSFQFFIDFYDETLKRKVELQISDMDYRRLFLLSWQSLRSVIKKSKANFIAFKQKKRASLYSTFFKCDDNHLLIWDCKTPKILLNSSRENFYIVKKSRTLTIEDKVTNFLLEIFFL